MNEVSISTGRRDWRPSLAVSRTILAGLLVTAGLPPYPWTGLLVVAGLALLLREMILSPRPARTAWIFALAHQTTLLYWLFMLDPAKSIPSRALVPLQAVLTILYVSVFYLGLGWAWGRLRGRLGTGRALLLTPVLWTVMEHFRAGGEMGFPWCLTGSSVIGTPLVFLVRAAGELGVGAGLVFAAVVVALLASRRQGAAEGDQLPLALVGAAVAWLLLGAGSMLEPSPPSAGGPGGTEMPLRDMPLAVAAVQADVALADKWVDAKIDSTKVPYGALTAAAAADGAEFIVWAETAIPAYVRYDQGLLVWTRDTARRAGAHLYTGFPDAEREAEGTLVRYNSSGLFGPGGELLGRYAKHHLLPIGEAMPFTSVLPFLAKVDVGQAEWSPGPPPVPLTVATSRGNFPFAGMICFESAFAWLARDGVRAGARCLVVITNDGWFGKSAGPRQHAALSRLRAVECDVPVIRSANNGISMVIDSRGRLLDQLGLGRRGVVTAELMPGKAATAFVRWGHQPLFAALALWTVVVLVAARRERRR